MPGIETKPMEHPLPSLLWSLASLLMCYLKRGCHRVVGKASSQPWFSGLDTHKDGVHGSRSSRCPKNARWSSWSHSSPWLVSSCAVDFVLAKAKPRQWERAVYIQQAERMLITNQQQGWEPQGEEANSPAIWPLKYRKKCGPLSQKSDRGEKMRGGIQKNLFIIKTTFCSNFLDSWG